VGRTWHRGLLFEPQNCGQVVFEPILNASRKCLAEWLTTNAAVFADPARRLGRRLREQDSSPCGNPMPLPRWL
jgi:hypothetical protein